MKNGIIVKNISNQYDCLVDNEIVTCRPRGKFRLDKLTPLVGDKVIVNTETKIIENILERTNELDRPRVSNIDAGIIVTSTQIPALSLLLLDKQIVLCESNDVEPVLIFSKLDLLNSKELKSIKEIMDYYKSIGYKVFSNTEKEEILKYLENKTVVLIGQSGAGKSTLINMLDKTKNIETKAVSESLGRGVHTTRNVEIHVVNKVRIMDTPGFSALDINKIEPEELRHYFIEFSKYPCQFRDCVHKDNCNLHQAVLDGLVKKERYENYLVILEECYESRSKLFK